MTVEVRTFFRDQSGAYVDSESATSIRGSRLNAEGYIDLRVDGQPLLDETLWDDVDWLWPWLARAVAECLQTGAGETMFADKPIRFRAEQVGGRRILLSVDGVGTHRAVAADRGELVTAMAAAAEEFFVAMDRLRPGSLDNEKGDLLALRGWAGPHRSE